MSKVYDVATKMVSLETEIKKLEKERSVLASKLQENMKQYVIQCRTLDRCDSDLDKLRTKHKAIETQYLAAERKEKEAERAILLPASMKKKKPAKKAAARTKTRRAPTPKPIAPPKMNHITGPAYAGDEEE